MAQAEGVYVQGAFDLFNPGDVAFLESAAALGERLVVGVLSDADVARSSGNPFLPIIPMHERALALLSQRAVESAKRLPTELSNLASGRALDEDYERAGSDDDEDTDPYSELR